MRTNNKGFTLIELVMVIVILGILAAVAIPKFANLSDNATKSTLQGAVGALKSGVVSYLGTHSQYPPADSVTAAGVVISSDDFTITDDATSLGGDEYGTGVTSPNLYIVDNNENYVGVEYDAETGTVNSPADWSKQ